MLLGSRVTIIQIWWGQLEYCWRPIGTTPKNYDVCEGSWNEALFNNVSAFGNHQPKNGVLSQERSTRVKDLTKINSAPFCEGDWL